MGAEEVVEEKSRRRRKRRGEADEEQEEVVEDATDQRGMTAPKGRATRSRRHEVEETDSGNFVVRTVRDIRDYFRGVQDELDKVVWPTRAELFRLSRIVLAVTIASAIALGIIAFLFTELFILGFENEMVFLVFFVAVAIAILGYTRLAARRDDLKPY